MKKNIDRNKFLKIIAAAPVLLASGLTSIPNKLIGQQKVKRLNKSKVKISLNVYSFNQPLKDGSITLDDVFKFSAQLGFDAVDPTAYYFKNYPKLPPLEYFYALKRKAFLLGLDISGTGIRNDFTNPIAEERRKDIDFIKKWIEYSSKFGAPVLRIFAGKLNPAGYSWDQISEWMASDLRECVDYGKKHGVIVAIQNHNDFIKTSDQLLKIMKMVDSDWFGLVLDIGSLRTTNDPYEEIAKLAPYAVTWQVKENVYRNNKVEKVDLNKIAMILKESNYRGYIPIETLGPGNPKIKVEKFFNEVKNIIG